MTFRRSSRAAPPQLDPDRGLTGRLLELANGHRLHAVVAGGGPGPLVVSEAGMSAPTAEWVHTQRQISERARAPRYDRARYRRTDDTTEHRAILLRGYACSWALQACGYEAAHILSDFPLLGRLPDAGPPDVRTVCLQAGRVDGAWRMHHTARSSWSAESAAASLRNVRASCETRSSTPLRSRAGYPHAATD